VIEIVPSVPKFVLGSNRLLRYSAFVSSTVTLPYAAPKNLWRTEPGLMELAALIALTMVLFFATLLYFRDYRSAVDGFGDSGAYLSIANSIRHWNFQGLQEKQFWGYPYAVAALSLATRIHPDWLLLVMVTISCSVLSTVLAFRLWGGWVAALFAILNFDWLQRSYLGGSEPLFVLLLFGSFWASRKERWAVAALLAAGATVTRPVGVFALIAIGLFLLVQKRYWKLLTCTAIGIAIGALYVVPFWIYFGDPLYEFHRYQTADWHSQSAISAPFFAIGTSIIHNQQPWTNLLLTLGWIALVAAGSLAIYKHRSKLSQKMPVELYFAAGYLIFLFCYNSPQWARAEFARFAIPVLPLIYLSLAEWLPQDRRIVWTLAVISPVLAACSAIGIRNVAIALHAH